MRARKGDERNAGKEEEEEVNGETRGRKRMENEGEGAREE